MTREFANVSEGLQKAAQEAMVLARIRQAGEQRNLSTRRLEIAKSLKIAEPNMLKLKSMQERANETLQIAKREAGFTRLHESPSTEASKA